MNKVSSINLGGYPFTIDEDAYEYLRQYLEAIHRHFRGVEGNEEITSDIETRLAELFQASLGNRPIVTMKDVKDAVAVMGAPEDFGAEPLSENPKEKFKIKTGKRLFRNTEEVVIGGVCSGIAAYLGIPDPLWVRLFFVLVAISGGFGVPLYFILYAIMPKPKTASDWLAMRGEPINFSNIGRIIQEEVERLSGKISEFGDEINGKKKEGTDGKDSFKEGMEAVGSALREAGNSLQYFWKPILYIIGFALVVLFAMAWIGAATGMFFVYPFLDFLFPGKAGLTMIGLVNLFLIFGIPLISLVLLVSRLLFGTRVSAAWRAGLGIMWGISITTFFLLGSILGGQFSSGGQYKAQAGSFSGDTLYVAAPSNVESLDTWYNIDNEVMLSDNKLVIRNVRLSIVQAEGTNFELLKEVSSRGESNAEANKLASTVITDAVFQGNQLSISPYFTLSNGQKWRVQEVNYILKVPVGKYVKFTSENPWSMLRDLNIADDDNNFWENPNRLWKMSDAGLACTDCLQKSGSGITFTDFNSISVSGKIKVVIERGETYQAEVRGSENNREKVTINQVDKQLNISAGAEVNGSPVRLFLTLPKLTTVNLDATDDVQIKGFTDALNLNAKGGGYEVKIYGDMEVLFLNQEGENKVDLVGNCDMLNAKLSAGARLDAEKPGVRAANIAASVDSRADLVVREKITKKSDNSSRIRVKGNPEVVEQ